MNHNIELYVHVDIPILIILHALRIYISLINDYISPVDGTIFIATI